MGLSVELADISISILKIAEIADIDLVMAIDMRLAINEIIEDMEKNEPEIKPYEIGTQEWYDSLRTEMKDYFADGINNCVFCSVLQTRTG